MSNLKLVSIITPTYNRADLIGETMDSILSQDYPNLEYIIIDDGSRDETEKVVNKYKKKFSKRKIVYLKQKNTGETRAVNKGFSLAHGDIIAVINSDDPLLPKAINTIAMYMQKNPRVLAVYPDWEVIDEFSKVKDKVNVENFNYIKMLKEYYCMPGPGTFFKRECIKLTNGRDPALKYTADFAFWLKIGMYGEIARIPKTLATFRVHSGSQGLYAKGDEMAKERISLVSKIYSDPDLPQEAQSVRSASLSSAYYVAGKESIEFLQKIKYYFNSFLINPANFFGKVRYEGIKLKKRLNI